MKNRTILALSLLTVLAISLLALARPNAEVSSIEAEPTIINPATGMTVGAPDLKSANVLTFNPEGMLFIGDSMGGAVFAVDVKDAVKEATATTVDVKEIDKKVAALLGTTPDTIVINDIATNPLSQNVYLAVTRGRGASATPVLLRTAKGGALEEVSLAKVEFSKATLANAPGVDDKTSRGTSKRALSITDIAFADGHLYVAGLSNEEFASSVRRVPFPFGQQATSTNLEIFHAAHNRFETEAPVETFVPLKLKGQPHLIASYTCTPIAVFAVADLKDKKLLRGTTLAELGSGNRPLDMITYQRGGKEVIMLANSNRTLMSLRVEDLEKSQPLTTGVTAPYASAGTNYTAISQVGIIQLDNLNDNSIVVIQRNIADGTLNLRSYPKR